MAKHIFLIFLLSGCISIPMFSQDHGKWIDKGRYYENKINPGYIDHMKFSPDGKFLYTFDKENILKKWDLNTWEIVKEMKIDIENIKSVDINNDQTKIVVGTLNLVDYGPDYLGVYVFILDMATGKEIIKFDGVGKIQIIPYSSNIDDIIVLFHPEKDQVICSYQLDYNLGYASVYGGDTRLINASNGVIINSIEGYAPSFSFSHDGAKFSRIGLYQFMSSLGTGHIRDNKLSLSVADNNLENNDTLWSGRYYRTEGGETDEGVDSTFPFLSSIAFTPDDSKIYSLSDGGNDNIYGFNLKDRSIDTIFTKFKDTMAIVYQIVTTGDNNFIAAYVKLYTEWGDPGNQSAIYYINTKTHEVTDSIGFPDRYPNNQICVSPDGQTIAFASSQYYPGDNQTCLRIINPDFAQNILQADFRPDRRVCQTGDTVHFFDYSGGSPDTWEWDFGDGSTGDEQNPEHIYGKAGFYDVKLSVDNGKEKDFILKEKYIRVFEGYKSKIMNVGSLVFPNPVITNGDIKYLVKKPANIEITIYDSYGRCAAFYNAGFKPAGLQETIINTAGLAQGVYYYTLKAGSEVQTGEFIVVR